MNDDSIIYDMVEIGSVHIYVNGVLITTEGELIEALEELED